MSDRNEIEQLERAYRTVREMLLAERESDGCWVGQLSSSALATATAVSALSVTDRDRHADLIGRGVDWLVHAQNPDGGWGDTTNSPSNLATTVLVRAALVLSGSVDEHPECGWRTQKYITTHSGASTADLAEALGNIYGPDRTFAAPILTNCALAGMVAWDQVPMLPFEAACLPQPVLRLFHLHVVSYALPALIAIGQLLHRRRTRPNWFVFALRQAAIAPALKKLVRIQPRTGGFLEAIPLTSFVVMSLSGAGQGDHPVTVRGLEFIRRSMRADGSWPIDTNLSTWLTTQAVNTLGPTGYIPEPERTRDWLLSQQHTAVHPYTASAPGGWSWTPLDGGVPDADDTAGALLALHTLGSDASADPIRRGLRWLAGLQNDDGGWPTFCRGWRKLPFDRSGPDLTAHAIRAFCAWKDLLDARTRKRVIEGGFDYLRKTQREDGSWLPLWFGNQLVSGKSNPVYGTARVLKAYVEAQRSCGPEARRGVAFLVGIQNPDGGWGGSAGVKSSVEETALAVGILCDFWDDEVVRERTLNGARYLARRIAEDGLAEPTPIGLYFTLLWYWERLYPVIWSTGALSAVLTKLRTRRDVANTSIPPSEHLETSVRP